MRKRLIILVSFLLILPTPSAIAAPVTASAGETICDQTVGNAAGVTAYRLSSMYCVVEFKTAGSTTWTVPTGVTSIEYLVVAGGGGGAGGQASEHGGGGGGAGGVLAGSLNVSPGAINLTVGGGGSGGTAGYVGTNGLDSSLGGSLTAIGGGRGGTYFTGRGGPAVGGSGGGAGVSEVSSYIIGANGTAGQGNKGGSVDFTSTNARHGAGGGGAGGDGGNTTTSGGFTIAAGAGGVGTTSSITGSTTYYGGGGGGGGSSARGGGATGGGLGGTGGGGDGATYTGTAFTQPAAGISNTGGGGGGGSGTGGGNSTVGAAGGSGIVIIRYLLAPAISATPSISGSTTYGETLTATTGTWLYSPTSYTFQWSRAATVGGTYTNISGATSANYRLVTADVNQYLKVTVTATNSGGSGTSTSSASAAITRATPGTTLTVAAGEFIYRTTKELSVTSSVAGKVTFRANRETITGCRNLTLNAGNSFTRICSYKPSIHGLVVITVAFTPTDTSYENRSLVSAPYPVKRRVSARN